jgi:hypothetical protein
MYVYVWAYVSVSHACICDYHVYTHTCAHIQELLEYIVGKMKGYNRDADMKRGPEDEELRIGNTLLLARLITQVGRAVCVCVCVCVRVMSTL